MLCLIDKLNQKVILLESYFWDPVGLGCQLNSYLTNPSEADMTSR